LVRFTQGVKALEYINDCTFILKTVTYQMQLKQIMRINQLPVHSWLTKWYSRKPNQWPLVAAQPATLRQLNWCMPPANWT